MMLGAEGPGSGCGQYFILLMRPRCSKVSNVALSAAGRAKYGHWSDCGWWPGPSSTAAAGAGAVSVAHWSRCGWDIGAVYRGNYRQAITL